MIVVADTSPLNYLVLINAIELLPKLFHQVHVPTEVMLELQQPGAPERVRQWAGRPPIWLHVSMPSMMLAGTARLDRGEAQAISLAKELRADTLLIDERKGRRIAREYGLSAFGTITVLELAAELGILDLKPALDALRATTFRISEHLVQAALARDTARRLAAPGRQDQSS